MAPRRDLRRSGHDHAVRRSARLTAAISKRDTKVCYILLLDDTFMFIYEDTRIIPSNEKMTVQMRSLYEATDAPQKAAERTSIAGQPW